MKKYLFIALALILSSCHGTDQSLVDSHKDNAITINSSLNYEEAYSIISSHYKGCGRGSINLNEISVDSKLDQQNKVGRISQNIKAPLASPNYVAVIDIKPAASGSIVYIYGQGHEDYIKKWLNGESGCWF